MENWSCQNGIFVKLTLFHYLVFEEMSVQMCGISKPEKYWPFFMITRCQIDNLYSGHVWSLKFHGQHT